MSKIHHLVVVLEQKMFLLKEKMDFFSQENAFLKETNQTITTENEELKREIELWRQKYEALKVSSSISGSDENKTNTKIKINALIREIDMCISQLSDK